MIKLSVHIVTYNHEQFIAQALDSVLMQQVNFDYEVVIGEDCSPDRTGEIVREYAERHPSKIRILPREKNLGGRKNWLDVYANCRGEYIALLDGDDYWTSPHKLQKQVDLLDSRRDLINCFHAAEVLMDTGELVDKYPPGRKDIYTIADLGEYNFIPTSSVVLRNGYMRVIPPLLWNAATGDWAFHVLHVLHGAFGYIDEKMSIYRIHEGGVFYWRRKNKVGNLIENNEIANQIMEHIGPEYSPVFKPEILRRHIRIAELLLEEERYEDAKPHADSAWSLRRYNKKFSYKQLFMLKMRTQSKFINDLRNSYVAAKKGLTEKLSGGSGRQSQ